MPEEDDFDVVYGIPSCFTKSVMNGIIKRNSWGYHKNMISYGREFRK
ncbi:MULTISPECIES: hypothetical protein [Prevotella]|nr:MULTISPECIES: hypothetical protein [Prevotella]